MAPLFRKKKTTSSPSAPAASTRSATTPSSAPLSATEGTPSIPLEPPVHPTSTTPIYQKFSPSRRDLPQTARESTESLTSSAISRSRKDPVALSIRPDTRTRTPELRRPDQVTAPAIPASQSVEENKVKLNMATTSSPPSKVDGAKNRAEHEKDGLTRQGKQVKSGLTPLKVYLLGYNVLSALLWGHLLYITVSFLLTPKTALSSPNASSFLTRLLPSSAPKHAGLVEHLKGSYNYQNLGWWTKYTQTLAVLEVVHAALGWVRSPVATVAAQVASRVWTVWGVAEAVPEVSHSSPLFATMLLAWSLTEVIRYTFYALSILSIQSPTLNWLRYTTFIPLYPLGAGSEAFLSFSTLPPILPAVGQVISYLPPKIREVLIKTKLGRELLWNLAKLNVKSAGTTKTWGPLEFARLGLFIIWWPALYVLYTYMLKQRQKVLGKGKTVGGVNKAR